MIQKTGTFKNSFTWKEYYVQKTIALFNNMTSHISENIILSGTHPPHFNDKNETEFKSSQSLFTKYN